jgi:hypothetical protein
VSLPEGLIKQIRNFAKQLEPWTKTALDGFNDNLVMPKVQKIRQVSHFLRRFTSLNHLASAARSVLESESAASDMYTDLEAVDIQAIQAQAQLICPCPREAVYDLHSQFLDMLKQHVRPLGGHCGRLGCCGVDIFYAMNRCDAGACNALHLLTPPC